MFIDVALTPAEIAQIPSRDLSGTTCVVFDVLRATSSMITGLAHGADAIYPVRTVEEAMELKGRFPDAILAGERFGDLIPGFELGNSPLEYREGMAGRTLISTTTNGTVALRACEHADQVLVGALLNMEALRAVLAQQAPRNLLIVCAGTFEEFALEDATAAGILIGLLKKADLSDAAQATLALPKLFTDPLDALSAAKNGRVLNAKGRGAEVEFCAQLSHYSVVGAMEDAVIRPLPR